MPEKQMQILHYVQDDSALGARNAYPIRNRWCVVGHSSLCRFFARRKLKCMVKLVPRRPEPDEDRLEAAHRHCRLNRVELQSSDLCGCFYCFAIFAPAEISEWTDDGETALCPKCPIDSVIGSASGFPITPEFLHRMHDKWF